MEGPISFWGYKEQESNLILPEHDNVCTPIGHIALKTPGHLLNTLPSHNFAINSRKTRDFSLLQNSHTNSGAHAASYLMGTVGTFLEVKQPGHNTLLSPPSNAGVKNVYSHTSTACICHHGTDRDNFTL